MSYRTRHDPRGAYFFGLCATDMPTSPMNVVNERLLPHSSSQETIYSHMGGHSRPAHGMCGRLLRENSPPFIDSAYQSLDCTEVTAETALRSPPGHHPSEAAKTAHNFNDAEKSNHELPQTTSGRTLPVAYLSNGPVYPENSEIEMLTPNTRPEIHGPSEPHYQFSRLNWLEGSVRQQSPSPITAAKESPLSQQSNREVVSEKPSSPPCTAKPRPDLDRTQSAERWMNQTAKVSGRETDGAIKVRRWLADKEYSLESLVQGPIPLSSKSPETMVSPLRVKYDRDAFTERLEKLTLCDHPGTKMRKIEFLAEGDIEETEAERTLDDSDASSYSSVAFTESFVEHDYSAEEPYPVATEVTRKYPLKDMLQNFLESLSLNRVDIAKEILLAILTLENAQDVASDGGGESSSTGANSRTPVHVKASQSLSPEGHKRQRRGHKRTERDQRDDDDDDPGTFKKPKVQGGTEEPRRLACLYYKRNPGIYNGITDKKFRTCAGPGWLTVHHLKEHLDRKHKRAIRCDRCHTVFKTKEARTEHSRIDPPCQVLNEEIRIEELNEDQQVELKKQSPRNLSERDKWIDLYKRVFAETNDARVPDSYYGVEDSWTRTWNEIETWLREQHLTLANPTSIDTLVNRLERRRNTQNVPQETPHAPLMSRMALPVPELHFVDTQSHGPHLEYANSANDNTPNYLVASMDVNGNGTSFAGIPDTSTEPTDRSEIFSQSAAGPPSATLGDSATNSSIHNAVASNWMTTSVPLPPYNAYQLSPTWLGEGQLEELPQAREQMAFIDPRNCFPMMEGQNCWQMAEEELSGMQKDNQF